MEYTVIIGLEVHVQLLTKSKLFCGCANLFNPDHPNVQTCPVCLGLPGALPVMNRHAVELSVKTGLALNCDISSFSKWDRKQYYYPDLPKAYQISQFDLPLNHDGWVDIDTDPESGETRRIRILRAHLEEDAGKNLHDETGRGRDSRVDLNRCGTPLLEIVTEPDLRSAAEAKSLLEELRLLLTDLEVSDCNMQEGSLRCDANVNLHVHTDDGHSIPTPIVEIKNLNSFRAVEAAIEFEVARQAEQFAKTGKKLGDVPKETRGWDDGRKATFGKRGKEEASDYRYLPDPDLVPVIVSQELQDELRATLCESPGDRRRRFMAAYELSHYDASVIVGQGKDFAEYFEAVARDCQDGKLAANWVTQDVLRESHERHVTIDKFPVRAEVLGSLLSQIQKERITTKSGREVFQQLLEDAEAGTAVTPDRVESIIAERGLEIVNDSDQVLSVIDAVLARNAKIVEDVRGGKAAAAGPLIGQVMKELKGADPKTVRELILSRITEG